MKWFLISLGQNCVLSFNIPSWVKFTPNPPLGFDEMMGLNLILSILINWSVNDLQPNLICRLIVHEYMFWNSLLHEFHYHIKKKKKKSLRTQILPQFTHIKWWLDYFSPNKSGGLMCKWCNLIKCLHYLCNKL